MNAISNQPPGRQEIKGLSDGQSIEEVYLVTDKQLRSNRNGNPYIQVELCDRSGSITGRQWNADEGRFRSFEVGDYLQIQGKVQLFQGSLQIIVNRMEKMAPDTVDLAQFLPHTTKNVGQMVERLNILLRSLENHHLRALAECFLMDHTLMSGFARAPAGVRQHHAYIGGLLEHVVTQMEVADRLVPFYGGLNRDLFLLGIFLHDIGKVRELSYDGPFSYSDEGQLVGHIVIGVFILEEKARLAEKLTGEAFPVELLLRLKHIIVSHHGTLEFGSPVVPMTPEAIAVHHLDNLDAKLNIFTRKIQESSNDSSSWTNYDPSLNRRLFKGRKEGPAPLEDADE
ncbi:MAG: 3'-5' exoribonuclease YhaM family protein [Gemmataceae bacterium]